MFRKESEQNMTQIGLAAAFVSWPPDCSRVCACHPCGSTPVQTPVTLVQSEALQHQEMSACLPCKSIIWCCALPDHWPKEEMCHRCQSLAVECCPCAVLQGRLDVGSTHPTFP